MQHYENVTRRTRCRHIHYWFKHTYAIVTSQEVDGGVQIIDVSDPDRHCC